MSPIDLAVVVGLSYFAYKGYQHGLAHEMISVGVVFLACFMSFRYTNKLAPHLADSIPGPAFIDTSIAFLLLFGLTLVTGRYINTMVRRIWLQARKSPGNRLAGLSFGIFKGAVVLGCCILLLRSFTPDANASEEIPTGMRGRVLQFNAQMETSYLAPRLAELTNGIFTRLIDSAERQVDNITDDEAGE